MTETEQSNLSHLHEYFAALQQGEAGATLSRFFSADVIQVEFPNRFNPHGQQSDLASIIARSIQGQAVLSAQHYEIVSELAAGDKVAVEVRWSATLAVTLGELPAGTVLKASFAIFLEFRQGLIVRQHNYDCFEAW